jgi:hypothetical protein
MNIKCQGSLYLTIPLEEEEEEKQKRPHCFLKRTL